MSYDEDIEKAVATAERMRKGGPNNVLWLIVQQVRYVAGILLGVNRKVDLLLDRPSRDYGLELAIILTRLGQVAEAERQILERLDALEPPKGKPGARIVVRGPVSDR